MSRFSRYLMMNITHASALHFASMALPSFIVPLAARNDSWKFIGLRRYGDDAVARDRPPIFGGSFSR